MAITNPNSSGQGHDPDHKDNPHHATMLKHGYVYSHSTPVHHQSGIVNHHTYTHPDLKDHVASVYKPSKMNSHVWSTHKLGAGSSHEGQGDADLDKHLKGHIARAKKKMTMQKDMERLNAVEQLIRQKLSTALNEQRKRIATKLFTEVIQPAATAPTTPGGRSAVTSTPKNDPLAKTAPPAPKPSSNDDMAAIASKKKDKMGQITAQRQKLQALQAKTSSAKDPNAMRQQIQAQQQKLSAMTQELTAIK
jgi:hypothetical protein